MLLLLLAGCGKSGPEPTGVQGDGDAGGGPPPVAPAPGPAAKPVRRLVLTPEMENAVVLVRVSVGGTRLRDHAGMMLAPEALPQPMSGESTRRLIAVLLPGYDAAALRNPSCLIQVLRTKYDPNGNPYVMEFKGVLAHLDEGSHTGVVQITEDFPCRLEPGLAATALGMSDPGLLQAVFNAQTPVAAELPKRKLLRDGSYGLALGTAQQGTLEVSLQPARLDHGVLTVVAGSAEEGGKKKKEEAATQAAAVLSEDGRLAGFAEALTAGGQWSFAPLPKLAGVKELRMLYVPRSVKLSDMSSNSPYKRKCLLRLEGVLEDPLKELASTQMVVKLLPSADFTPAANPREDQPEVVPDGQAQPCMISPDGSIHLQLDLPKNEKETFQLVQLWLQKRTPHGVGTDFHTVPFLVVTKKRGAGVYHRVAGVEGPADALPGDETPMAGATAATTTAAENTAKPLPPRPLAEGSTVLTTESPILYGLPMREGREVLFRLDGAPYWKRLSLAEGKWLPLPAEDLSLCVLAGNKEALFVLNPAERELRRFDAESLKLEKTAQLPQTLTFTGLAAGCLTSSGPLALVHAQGVLACRPKDLVLELYPQLRQETGSVPPEKRDYYTASGDGLGLWGLKVKKDISANLWAMRYLGPLRGFAPNGHQPQTVPPVGSQPTVSASCPWSRGANFPGMKPEAANEVLARPGSGTLGPLANSPNFYEVRRESRSREGLVLRLPQCAFYSYGSAEPWATADVPEAGDEPPGEWESFSRRVWLDVTCLKFAIWHHERTITLHSLKKEIAAAKPQAPVLLNYPDCHVARGSAFHFAPQFLGEPPKVTADDDVPPGFAQGAGGIMDWLVPETALARQVAFGMTAVPRLPDQSLCKIRLALQLEGMPPPVAVPPTLRAESAAQAVAEAGMGRTTVPMVPLKSFLHECESPVECVLPGLDDYLALLHTNRRLVLFSVEEQKAVGSCQLEEPETAFMAGDVVLIFNQTLRELTRRSLPDFTVTHRYALPMTAKGLSALGTGRGPAGPVTLLMKEDAPKIRPGSKVPPYYTPTLNKVVILDKQTLGIGLWAPYVPPQDAADRLTTGLEMVAAWMRGVPVALPASQDGRLVAFPFGRLMISPRLTLGFAPEGQQLLPLALSGRTAMPTTTPTADRVFYDGHMVLDGQPALEIQKDSSSMNTPVMSLCGDCVATLRKEEDNTLVALLSPDDGRPLLGVAGLDVLAVQDGEMDSRRRQVMPLGDKNLLAVLSRGGRLLQVMELDLSTLCRGLSPDSAYVTSHPFTIVTEGRTLDYQVMVNNPAAVDHYELRDTVDGASITNQGLLTYRAPLKLPTSRLVSIAILIRLKSGASLLHQVPVYALALKPAKPAMK